MSDVPCDIDAIAPWPADPTAFYGYDLAGRLLTRTDFDGNTTVMVYDDRGRTSLTVQPNGLCIFSGYDNAGQLVRRLTIRPETVPAALAVDAEEIASFFNPAAENPMSSFIGSLNTYLLELGGVEEYEVIGSLESFTYDANGNRLTQTDPVEIRWTEVDEVFRPDPSILMRFAASEHTTRMTYDSANRLLKTANALSTPSDPRVWAREYNAAGQLVARTDANGTRIVQAYNADGQLASIDYPNGKRVTYDWTCCRMASISDDYGRSRFTYDVANRLVSAVDATGHVVLNRYDASGRRAALTLPDGSAYAYDYDVYGQIDKIEGRNGISEWVRNPTRRLEEYYLGMVAAPTKNVRYVWEETYLLTATDSDSAFGEAFVPTDPQMPGASPLDVTDGTLGFVDTLTVRRDLRVTSDVHTGGSTEMNLTYTYDPAGNRTGREDLLATPVTADYEYFNAANQLVGQKPVQGTTPLEILGNMIELATQPHNITVDKNGNITKIDYYSMVYVDADPGVPVDPEWQRLHTFTWNFRFDYENRLIEARGAQIAIPNALDPDDDDPAPIPAEYYNYEFGYDGLGRRVWTQQDSTNGSWFIYDGDQIVQERDFRSDALIVEYAWGPTTGAPAIFYQRRLISGTPQERWIYTSPQGAFPRHLFDLDGTITDTFQYSSFGEIVFHEGGSEVAFGWQQGFRFAESSPMGSITIIPGWSSGYLDPRTRWGWGSRWLVPTLGKSLRSLSINTLRNGGPNDDPGDGPGVLPAIPIPSIVDEHNSSVPYATTGIALLACCHAAGQGRMLRPSYCHDSGGVINPTSDPDPDTPCSPIDCIPGGHWLHPGKHGNCLSDMLLLAGREIHDTAFNKCLSPYVLDKLKAFVDIAGNPNGVIIKCKDDLQNNQGDGPGRLCTNCNGNGQSPPTIFVNCSEICKNPTGLYREVIHELIHAAFCSEYMGVNGEIRALAQNCSAFKCLRNCNDTWIGAIAHKDECVLFLKSCPTFCPGCGASICFLPASGAFSQADLERIAVQCLAFGA